ncbi:hypothetical protein [Providencia phage PSTCR5]|uniref:Uncharacterized protein n=1 Tax=Providencia phage PSTCR5 TaxID=2783547 RepID=A0A873WL66_9CAUD|nr:hypothetical protein KNV68_gp142 [Providencia phage PSTCR5]QPB12216.1 hypothetical protein [Providencia phage PSTCR5]
MTFRPYSDGNCNVAVQVGDGVIEHVAVPKPVYDYILQLENAVRDDTGYVKSRLKEIYPSRF